MGDLVNSQKWVQVRDPPDLHPALQTDFQVQHLLPDISSPAFHPRELMGRASFLAPSHAEYLSFDPMAPQVPCDQRNIPITHPSQGKLKP
jgi:hypothetical protein